MDNIKPPPSSEPNLFASIKDEKNKETIARGSLLSAVWSFFTNKKRPLTPKQVRLIEEATPKEREAYVRRQSKRMALVVLFAILFYGLSVSYFAMHLDSQSVASVQVTEAGTITSIELHKTLLSTATTVVTTAGTYHVRGAVSAAAGDQARLEVKKYRSFVDRQSLCVESSIKTACYPLM